MSKRDTRPAIVSGRSTRRAVQASRSSTPGHVGRLAHLDEDGEAARAEERDGVEVEHHQLDARRSSASWSRTVARSWGEVEHVDLTADLDHRMRAVAVHGERDLVIARLAGLRDHGSRASRTLRLTVRRQRPGLPLRGGRCPLAGRPRRRSPVPPEDWPGSGGGLARRRCGGSGARHRHDALLDRVAADSSADSAPGRPTSCTPTGRPPMRTGATTAGRPARFHACVNGMRHAERASVVAVAAARERARSDRRARGGGPDQHVVAALVEPLQHPVAPCRHRAGLAAARRTAAPGARAAPPRPCAARRRSGRAPRSARRGRRPACQRRSTCRPSVRG